MCFTVGSRVLVLAPHTDDAELGCGGTIARFLEDGLEVFVAAFSSAEQSLPVGAEPGTLRKEFLDAVSRLGISLGNVSIYDYPVRHFPRYRQEILEDMLELRKRIQPTCVLVPASTDLHQDHQVIHLEALRAFKEVTIWGYELPWNQASFVANVFVVLNRRHLEKKWDALQSYETQFALRRPYFSWDFVEGLARVRGTQIKEEFAEAFEAIRLKLG